MSALQDAAVPQYQVADEVASSVIHGIGILLSIAGLAVMVAFATLYGGARAITASAVYGTSLILLYTASTLYHSIPGVAAKRVFRTFDHIAIYLLIAGTYTPITLLALPPAWGVPLLVIIWTLALAGSVLELGLLKRYHKAAVFLYVAMGWVAMIAFRPLSQHMDTGGMALLIAGGLAYTGGVPFYLARKMPFHHAVWHVFVLAGSVLHFLAVLLYVLPQAP